MEEFNFKLNKSNSINNKKNKKKILLSMSFNSEKDDSNNTINNISPKTSNKLNLNNYSIYKSFHKHNKYNYTNLGLNSPNNISEEYNIDKHKHNNSSKIIKSYFESESSNNLNYKNKNSKRFFNLNNDNINILNDNKNIINYSKNISLRNTSNLNSGNFSTVKEEQEQNSFLKDNNDCSNNLLGNIKKEEYKIKIFYEGKNIDLILNKNDKFKKLLLLIQKKLFPFHQMTNFDILYKLKVIDIIGSLNIKLSDLIGDLPNEENISFLLRKKKDIKENTNPQNTIITIENFPSLTDLSIDLNYFFKKETSESDFIVDYKNNVCKVSFNYPEKAFSLVSFLTKLKLKKPIYKRLKINLDYKINSFTNANKYKQKPQKVMLPFLKKDIINNISNQNLDFYMKSPSYKRKNIKLFLPNYFSFSKNNKNIEDKGNDILFLYRKKQMAEQFNANNNNIKIMNYNNKNIMTYKDKDTKTPNKKLSEIKNKKLELLLNKDKNVINTSKRIKRNSVCYQSLINLQKNNEYEDNKNQINSKKEKIKNNYSLDTMNYNNEMRRRWSHIDNIKLPIKNKDNKNNNYKVINKDNNISNNDNMKINEKKGDVNLIEILEEAKKSEDDSNSSLKEEKSTYSNQNNQKNKNFIFKNKNKIEQFMFFNGLTKRVKKKNLEYLGKKY